MPSSSRSSSRPIGLCALAFVLGLAAPALADSVADGNAGLQALNRGDNAEAIRLFSRALKAGDMAPDDQEFAYLNRAKAYSVTGDLVSAIADLHQALRLKPDDTEARDALQAALEARRAQATGGAARATASAPAGGGRFGLLGSLADTWWACSKDGAVASYVAWGPQQADSLAMAQVSKVGAPLNATFKIDPLAGVLFGFTYKGDAIYGVVDAGSAGVTETYAMHGVPIRQTVRRSADGHLSEVGEAYRNGAWGPLETDDCLQTSAAEVAKVKWARKLKP